jgi:excinuclease ABC subunit A
VEHSDFFIKNSDYLISMGPGAGLNGGKVVNTKKIKKLNSERFLKSTLVPKKMKYLEVQKLEVFKTKPINIKIPKDVITWVNGDSGAGKSIYLVKSLAEYLNRMKGVGGVYDPSVQLGKLIGFDKVESVKVFDGGMSGISSRSTIATYLDIASSLRKYYSNLPVSKSLNLRDGHFSSNSDLGKCSTCDGKGSVEVDMTYFEDVDLVCEDCDGMKIRPYLANISDGEHTFYEAINLPLDVAFSKIKLTPKFRKLYERLQLLNLSHLNPDRKINTLSGGERLRIKLLSSLQKKIENSLLIFENISFGLSKNELVGLGQMIEGLILAGNTILIIDQNQWFQSVAHYKLTFHALGKSPSLAKIP